jgi:hypothetical protein
MMIIEMVFLVFVGIGAAVLLIVEILYMMAKYDQRSGEKNALRAAEIVPIKVCGCWSADRPSRVIRVREST